MAPPNRTMSDAAEPTRNANPGFLLSSERSGSNLVRSILNTHSEISAPHPYETGCPIPHVKALHEMNPDRRYHLVRDLLINKQFSHHPVNTPLGADRVHRRVEAAPEPGFLDLQRALYDECAQAEGTSRWMSKYPDLWDYLDEIVEYYDEPRFVYLVRDPRDVVLSFKTSNITLYHPYFSARRWQKEQAAGIRLREEHDDLVHVVRYRDLLQEPESVVEEVCGFLDLPFEEAMLYYYETEEAQETSESSGLFENLSVPIKSDNYDKFRDRLPDDEVKLTEKITKTELDEFGFNRVYSEDELDAFEFEPEAVYEREDDRMERAANRRYWRERPREQVKRSLTRSFSTYIVLRYGVLG